MAGACLLPGIYLLNGWISAALSVSWVFWNQRKVILIHGSSLGSLQHPSPCVGQDVANLASCSADKGTESATIGSPELCLFPDPLRPSVLNDHYFLQPFDNSTHSLKESFSTTMTSAKIIFFETTSDVLWECSVLLLFEKGLCSLPCYWLSRKLVNDSIIIY